MPLSSRERIVAEIVEMLSFILTKAYIERGSLDAVKGSPVVAAVEHGLPDVGPVRALAGRQGSDSLLADHWLRLIV